MATTNYSQNDPRSSRPPESIPDCEEKDNLTQKTINTIKKNYCDNLFTARHNVKKLEIIYESKERIYKKKEQRYMRIRDNYQRYVNTEINVGCQLIEANKRITTNVGNYKTWDDNLATVLKNIFTSVKDVKSKISDLRDAAIKLENSQYDSCSTAQWCILTGKNPDNCKDEQKPPAHHHHHEQCKDIDKVIEKLVCMPKALATDIDSIFKASSDIIGIEKFCNTISIVGLQTELSKKTQDFDGLLQATITTRKTDLDNSQKDLIQSLVDRTDAVIDVYNQRCEYDGTYRTVSEICCPKCGCIKVDAGDCEPRLERCGCDICDICGEVRKAFVSLPDDTQQPAPAATT
jgi:hypothetical protein